MTENKMDYFKVHVSFLQEQELLVAANSAEDCQKLVEGNVLPSTEQFKIISITPLSAEEKEFFFKQMMEPDDIEDAETEKRVLN